MRVEGVRVSRRRSLASGCPHKGCRNSGLPMLSEPGSRTVCRFFRTQPCNQEKSDLPWISLKPKAAYWAPQNRGSDAAVLGGRVQNRAPKLESVLGFHKLHFT